MPCNSRTSWCGSARKASSRPSSCMICKVEGWIVSPRKSRRKSRCFSKTTTSTPARASRKPSMIPAGPPPAIAQAVRGGRAAVIVLLPLLPSAAPRRRGGRRSADPPHGESPPLWSGEAAFFDDCGVDDRLVLVHPASQKPGDDRADDRHQPEQPELRDIVAARKQSR